MRKIALLLVVGLVCMTGCAQKKGGERGPRQGGHMVINKDSDSVFVALKKETLGKFKQFTFNDEQTGKTMEYNLLIPEGAEAGEKLPLVLFMADASTAGKEVTAPLTQGYGALEFASDRDLISRGTLSLYEVDAYTMIMNGGLQQIKDYL